MIPGDQSQIEVTEDQLRIAREEARRRKANASEWLSYDEIEAEAYFILTKNAALTGALLRLKIKGRLLEFLSREKRKYVTPVEDQIAERETSQCYDSLARLDFECLTPFENRVLSLVYLLGFTERDAAKELGHSKTAVHEAADRAIAKLREHI